MAHVSYAKKGDASRTCSYSVYSNSCIILISTLFDIGLSGITMLQTWSSRDLSLGLKTSRDPFLQVLVSVLVLNRSLGLDLGLGLGLGISESWSWSWY